MATAVARKKIRASTKPAGKPVSCKLDCQDCPQQAEWDNLNNPKIPSFVYRGTGKKKLQADVFFVCEAPGETEDELGEPLVGSAGNIHWTILDTLGFVSVANGNVEKCRPEDNRTPTSKEIAICKKHLLADIAKVHPKVVVIMGGTAVKAMLKTKASIQAMRGWHRIAIKEGYEVDAFVTYHPSAVHYDADKKSVIEDDLRLVKARIDGDSGKGIDFKDTFVTNVKGLKDQIAATIRWCKKQKRKGKIPRVAFDWEGMDLDIINVRPLSFHVGYSLTSPRVWGLTLRHPKTSWTSRSYKVVLTLLSSFLKTLEDLGVEILAHGAKFDVNIVRSVLKCRLQSVVCTQQLAHLTDENRLAGGQKEGIYSLEALSNAWLGLPKDYWDDQTSDLIYGGRGDQADPQKLVSHGNRDVAATLKLRKEIIRRNKQEGFSNQRIYPLVRVVPRVLSEIEYNGMPVDEARLAKLMANSGPFLARQKEIVNDLERRKSVQRTLKLLGVGYAKVKAIFSEDGSLSGFKPSKPAHRQTLFFNVLDIPWGEDRGEQTPTGQPRVDKEFYKSFENIEEVALVAEWTSLNTIKNTFLKSWWEFSQASHDRRIRPSIFHTGTNTGRLTMKRPNLQQIPSGKAGSDAAKKAAKAAKMVFRPHCYPGDPLRVIVSADLSQAEVRGLAENSGEPTLINLYKRRREMMEEYAYKPSKKLWERIQVECDIHISTAAEMFGIPIKTVTSSQRRGAKSITFGNIYGQTVFGLALGLGISNEEAEALLKTWMKRLPKAQEWFNYIENFALKHGWVESLLGRRRRLQALLLDLSDKVKKHCLRVARNAPLQGLASDINIWIASKLQDHAREHNNDWQLIGLVHDSIIAEMPIGEVLPFTKTVKEIAEDEQLLQPFGIKKLLCPQESEVEVGYSYGELITLTPCVKEQEQVVETLDRDWRKAA